MFRVVRMLKSLTGQVAAQIASNTAVYLFHVYLDDGHLVLERQINVFSPQGITGVIADLIQESNPFPTKFLLYGSSDRSVWDVDAVVEMECSPLLMLPHIELQALGLTLREPRFESVDELMRVVSNAKLRPFIIAWERRRQHEVMRPVSIESVQSATSAINPGSSALAEFSSPVGVGGADYSTWF